MLFLIQGVQTGVPTVLPMSVCVCVCVCVCVPVRVVVVVVDHQCDKGCYLLLIHMEPDA